MNEGTTLPPVLRPGPQRDAVRTAIARRYRKGNVSIRDIARDYKRSFGWAYQMLAESGVKLRPRGGRRTRDR